MTERKYVKVEAGERVEKRDFEAVAEASRVGPLTVARDFLVGGDRATSPIQLQHYIISGFTPSIASPNLTVTKGSGANGAVLVAGKVNGVAEYGYVVSGGDTSKTIDLSSYGVGTYKIYIKMDLQITDLENRIFWNADAVTPVEISKNIPTRTVETWAMTVEASLPGDEWIYIGDVTMDGGGNITGLTDKRPFFFEGRVDLAYDPTNDWGGGTDRNADRKTEGIFGLRRFVRAMQTQVAGIMGGAQKWWETPAYTLDGLNTAIGANTSLANTKVATAAAITGWIKRPKFEWVSSTQVRIQPCSYWNKGVLRRVAAPLTLTSPADIVSGDALGLGDWGYVYLRDTGTPTLRVSSEAPSVEGIVATGGTFLPEATFALDDYLYVGCFLAWTGDTDIRQFDQIDNFHKYRNPLIPTGSPVSYAGSPQDTTLRLPDTTDLAQIESIFFVESAGGPGDLEGLIDWSTPTDATISAKHSIRSYAVDTSYQIQGTMVLSLPLDGGKVVRSSFTSFGASPASCTCNLRQLGFWEFV